MPSLVDIVTTQKVALENERDAMVLAHAQRLADLNGDITRCTQLLAAFVTYPQILIAVDKLGEADLLPVIARDLDV